MKNKFTKAIAKEIASDQFNWVLDCVLGKQDPDWSLEGDVEDFEQEFTERLENNNIIATPARIKVINDYYTKIETKAKLKISKLYILRKSSILKY